MGYLSLQKWSEVLALAARQHGVVTHAQLRERGFSPQAIKHRVASGLLHRLQREVFAVGRAQISQRGIWMAAVLACGPQAVLSHESAAALWEIRAREGRVVEVSIPAHASRTRPGVRVHRREFPAAHVTAAHGIAVTSPAVTLVDLAWRLPARQVEAAVNEADKRDLIAPDALRAVLDEMGPARGVRALRLLLDRRTFALTDSELERRFLVLARRAGLPTPETGARLNGFKVDFLWPQLGLVVETDGLRYHRTPAQQARDRERDQAHTAVGLTTLRFTHAQVAYEDSRVEATLRAVARRLGRLKRE
jgi:very-short-patch-repair endonuclease/predicted transcriptional regulator of viral defense system